MSNKSNLNKEEALELITPVVDGEVDESTRDAFLDYIEQDQDVRGQYESLKRVKQIISTRCPYTKAPGHLKKKINDFLEEPEQHEKFPPSHSEPIYDIPCDHSVDYVSDRYLKVKNRFSLKYAFAAVFVLVIFFGSIFLWETATSETYNIEEHAYSHFIKNKGQMVTPTISTADYTDAELQLASAFDMSMTIPTLRNANFKGIVYSNFVSDFKTPMLEYHLPSEDQYIFIFAFKISDLNRFEQLTRSEEAVESCVDTRDFHIRNVNGKHIVSWKWNDTWYAAVSNHDGQTLASLVEPLE